MFDSSLFYIIIYNTVQAHYSMILYY